MKKTFQITLKDDERLIFEYSKLSNFRIFRNIMNFPKLKIIK